MRGGSRDRIWAEGEHERGRKVEREANIRRNKGEMERGKGEGEREA